MRRKFLVFVIISFIIPGLVGKVRAQEKPLTKDQILALVRNQMADEAGAKIVAQRGIDFTPTDDYLNSLKISGASDAFIQALRAAGPSKSSSGADANKKTLSQVQILALLSGDVPSSRVAMLVSQRGIDFQPTDEFLKSLEISGAEQDLIDALRAAKPVQSVSGSAATQNQQAEVQQHLAAGLALRKHGQYPEAEQEYRTASSLDPNNVDLLVSLATVLYHEKKSTDAIATAQKAVMMDPSNDHAHNALGMAYGGSGDNARAITEFREAVRLNPTNDVAVSNLGVALSRSGDPEGAAAQYREAIRINSKNYLAHNNLGFALKKLGDLDGAIQQYREALRLNPNYDVAHFNLGLALDQKGFPKLALQQMRIATQLKPDVQAYRQAYEKLSRQLNQK